MTPPFVYALADPRTPEHVRYVGLAMRASRPYDHSKIARKGKRTYVYNWIRSIQTEGFEPLVLFLESCTKENVGERERHYINHFHSAGHPLTNMREGGLGSHALTEEAKNDIIRKISNTLKGHPGCNHTQEARAKISAKLKGCVRSPETRAKMSAAKKGIPSPNKIIGPHKKPSRLLMEAERKQNARCRRIPPTEETRKKLREAMARYYAIESNREKVRQKTLLQHQKRSKG